MSKICNILIVLWLVDENNVEVNGTIGGYPTISGVICVDQNSFALCDSDGFLTNGRYNCAIGSICMEISPEIRKPLLKIETPRCDKNSGKCSKTSRFACVGKNKFALCIDGKYPSGMIYTRPSNTMCSTTTRIPSEADNNTRMSQL